MDRSSLSPRRSSLKVWLLAALLLVLLVSVLCKGGWLGTGPLTAESSRQAKADSLDSTASNPRGRATPSSKVSQRKPVNVTPTHEAAQLVDFYLPEVDIRGLSLAQALEKLREAYHDACQQSGEVPIPLEFSIPPGKDKPLHLKVGVRTLDQAVRLLAALSGLKVSLDGSTYVFEEIGNTATPTDGTLTLAPDFLERLTRSYDAGELPSRAEIKDYLQLLGLELDPATILRYDTARSELKIEAPGTRDGEILAALAQLVSSEGPRQQRLESKLIEIPANEKWTAPESASLDARELKALFDELSERKEIEITEVPSVTARNGETATVEIIRELITPVDEAGKKFAIHTLGKVMLLEPNLLGFGSHLDLDFTDTTGGINPDSGKAAISKHTDINRAGYAGEGRTRIMVQTRPDGSRTVLLVTATTIDAIGRAARTPR